MQPKPLPYQELLKTFNRPAGAEPRACPICELASAMVARFLDDFIYSLVLDPKTRDTVRQARGFCSEHAGQLHDTVGVGLGVALVNWDVLETVLEELAGARAPVGPAGRLRGLRLPWAGARLRDVAARLRGALAARCPCLVCQQQRIAEETYLGMLLRYVADAELQAAFRVSPGLCLPHFDQALGLATDAGTLGQLVELETLTLRRLSDELAELTRKYDYNFRHELLGAERDAWLRSLGIVSGRRGIR